jgi:threonine dehydrogenase-like Zn-dependent dehydrogenase
VFAAAEELDPAEVYRRELTVLGSRSATPRHLEQAVAMLPELEPIPTEILPLDRFNEGLERYRSRAATKIVFVP